MKGMVKMRIEWGKMQEMKLENFYGGKKELYANMYADEKTGSSGED